MGKQIVIKGADFSENAAEHISKRQDITSLVQKSPTGKQYIHYPYGNLNNAFQARSGNDSRICVLDVSNYVGKKILFKVSAIRSSTFFQGGAWWICFASSIKVSFPWTGTNDVQNAVTAISYVSGLAQSLDFSVYNDYEVIVPEGANYLIARDFPVTPIIVYLYE